GGRIQEFSWEGELLWDWKYANEEHLLHHDIEPLPNGNVLAIAWEAKSAQETNQAGRRPDLIPKVGIWPTQVIEIEPQRPNGGRIVWEWHSWDHLVQDVDQEKSGYGTPSEHPELIDINGDHKELKVDAEELARLQAIGYVPDDAKQDDLRSDVFHVNAIDYNSELDQIVLSSNVRKEIWVIDHSTTTEEAKGHSGGRWGKGGDLLYRWGNPATYGRGSEELPKASNQHDIQWIPEGYPGAGHLLKFVNNLETSEGKHSAIYEFIPPTNDDGSYVIPSTGPIGPTEPFWKYEAPDKTSFHSSYISGAQRLLNGNTFICSGAKGRFMEVTPEGEIVWEYWDPYSNPDKEESNNEYSVFRAAKLLPNHPGLQGRELQPIEPQPQTAAERKAAIAKEKSTETRGLIFDSDKKSPGYVLFAPHGSKTTFLADKSGDVIHLWKSDYFPGRSAYLRANGNLLRGAQEPHPPVFKGGGQGGRIQEFSWDGELLWDWSYATEEHLLHHDIEPLPNGNVLAIAWEAKSAQEANQAGRRPDLIPKAGIWPTHVVEIEPQHPDGGRIVWEWHSWDHLIQDFDREKSSFGAPSAHPELIDINGDHRPLEIDADELARLKAIGYVPDDAQQKDLRSDLFHVNAIDYNPTLDQIVLSSNTRKEFWVIDHSTTTEEARGHSGGRWGKGGDLLYRWGNPATYGRGNEELPQPSNQHDIQ
ncbi:aryl-sulfate sulfotransferase, partial [Verrucomicrobia bacterium]|nr:aryl-sulfate sulfotransferase [Verrucomicrobiota bacterium]